MFWLLLFFEWWTKFFILEIKTLVQKAFLGSFDLFSQFIWGSSLYSEGLHSAHFKYSETWQACHSCVYPPPLHPPKPGISLG